MNKLFDEKIEKKLNEIADSWAKSLTSMMDWTTYSRGFKAGAKFASEQSEIHKHHADVFQLENASLLGRVQELKKENEGFLLLSMVEKREIKSLKAKLDDAVKALKTLKVAVNDKGQDLGATNFITQALSRIGEGGGE